MSVGYVPNWQLAQPSGCSPRQAAAISPCDQFSIAFALAFIVYLFALFESLSLSARMTDNRRANSAGTSNGRVPQSLTLDQKYN